MKRLFTASLLVSVLTLTGRMVDAQNFIQSQVGFGYAVHLTESGIAVGEPLNGGVPGMVYIFERDGMSGWHVTATLKAGDGRVGDRFGTAITGGDGRLFVSATGSADAGGAVYAFRKGDGGWMQEAVLRPAESSAGDAYGVSIAYSDGQLFVAHPSSDDAPVVHVYGLRDGSWVETATVTGPDDSTHASFASAVATDGTSLYVGAPRDEAGVVYAFQAEANGAWAHTATLRGATNLIGMMAEGDEAPAMGFGTKILAAGGILFVTAPNADNFTGRVYTFAWTPSGVYSRGPVLLAFDGNYGHSFARQVAYAGDEVWISALTPNNMAGGIYRMHISEDGREVVASSKLIEPRVLPQTFYGESMAGRENLVVVGANQDAFRSGSVYVYERDPHTGEWSSGTKLMAPRADGYASVRGEKVKCQDGKAEGFGCENVDLVSFVTRNDLGLDPGMLMNDLWGWTDAETGKEYVLAGSNDRTTFVDVSNPTDPVVLGYLERTKGSQPSIWRDMKVYKDHAFIVADGAGAHGVQIFDLRQLRDVENPPVAFKETARYDGIFSAHNIAINEQTGFAYSVGNSAGGETCGGGSHVIDVRDPANPKFAGCFAHAQTGRAGTGYTHDAQCVIYNGPDERYTGREICLGANETAISISDVSEKGKPVAISTGSYPNPGYTHQGWLSEDHRHFFVNDELDEINGGTDGTRTLIWDVAELDDPILVNEYVSTNKASDHNLYIRGNLMYQSNYVSGLRIVDVSNVEAPVEVGHFDTVPWGPDKPGFGGSWSNFPFFKSGVIVVSSAEEGLFVLKRSEVDS